VDLGREAERASLCKKAFGAVGTAAGAVLGRAAAVIGTGIAGALALGAIAGGPVTIGIGALAGLALGFKMEKKAKIGRILGGLIGGATGMAAGIATSKLSHYTPSRELAGETQGFSFKSLFEKLKNPLYTSHKFIA
jgi:hypothetical protein